MTLTRDDAVKPEITYTDVRSPRAGEWIRVNPDPAHRQEVMMLNDPRDGEEYLPQPVDHRDHGRHVGGIARPHLRAHWPPVAVEQHGEDHLPQVRAVIVAVAVLAQRLAPAPSK
jgi:hypothetical protein